MAPEWPDTPADAPIEVAIVEAVTCASKSGTGESSKGDRGKLRRHNGSERNGQNARGLATGLGCGLQ